MLLSVRSEVDRINEQLKKIETETLEDWARALACQAICVALSGALENCFRHIIAEYCRRHSDLRVLKAVNRFVGTYQNPKTARICELLESFDAAWRDDLESYWTGRIKDSIDSIVANRNNIAHGRPTGVTPARLREFYKAFEDFLTFLDKMILT